MREISAGAVIFHRTGKKIEYLLLHYEWGHWDFVKGNIEDSEDLETTVRRETQEEAGLSKIKFIEGFKETIKYFYKKDGQNIFKIVVFLLGQSESKKVKLSFEHQDFKWLPYEKALEQLTFKNAKDVLKKANDFLGRDRSRPVPTKTK